MAEQDHKVTPAEFIELLEKASLCACYNGFTKDELKSIHAKATDLREISGRHGRTVSSTGWTTSLSKR